MCLAFSPSQVYDEGHIRRSVQIEDALQYQGKHFLLVCETGVMMAREWKAIEALDKAEGALSIKVVDGGFTKFSEEYDFLCEDSCSTHSGAMERTRRNNRCASVQSQLSFDSMLFLKILLSQLAPPCSLVYVSSSLISYQGPSLLPTVCTST